MNCCKCESLCKNERNFLKLNCEHFLCHNCVNLIAYVRTQKGTFQFPCPSCNTQYTFQPKVDLTHLSKGFHSSQLPNKKPPKDKGQRTNWQFGGKDNQEVIDLFSLLIGPNTEDRFIKEALITLKTIKYLTITIKLSKKKTETSMRKIISEDTFDLSFLDNKQDFSMLRMEYELQKRPYVNHIKNTNGNLEFYQAFILVLQEMKSLGYI